MSSFDEWHSVPMKGKKGGGRKNIENKPNLKKLGVEIDEILKKFEESVKPDENGNIQMEVSLFKLLKDEREQLRKKIPEIIERDNIRIKKLYNEINILKNKK